VRPDDLEDIRRIQAHAQSSYMVGNTRT